jgi:hypothetical protein
MLCQLTSIRRRFTTPLLAKALQHIEVHPDLSPPPLLGITQSVERRRREPSFHAKDDELPQPRAGGVELGLEIGFGELRRPRSPAGSDGTGAVGEELKLAGIAFHRCPQDRRIGSAGGRAESV